MTWFLLCGYEQPADGEWSDMAEFKLGEKDEIDREFENAITEGEYPLIVKGEVNACAKSAYEITEG